MNIKVLLADHHTILRQGLRSLLEKESDILVIAEAEDSASVLSLSQRYLPDIVIMDIYVSMDTAMNTIREIKELRPDIKVLVLSIYSEGWRIMESLKAGASGYLTTDCDLEELIAAIRTVVANQSYISPKIASKIIKQYITFSSGGKPDKPPLTIRERTVLQLMAEGHSTKEVARMLSISVKTVETHRLNLRDKLGIESIPGLIKYAMYEGMI